MGISSVLKVLVSTLLFPSLAAIGFAQEPTMADVLTSTPDRANAILYLDVPSVRALTKGSLFQADLSESMGEVRIASMLNLSAIEPSWEIGYVTVTGLATAQALAKSVDGYVDSISGKAVVWSPKQSYLVPMPNNVLGLVRPANRKLVGRWLKKENNGSAAEYLQKQAAQDTKFISVLLAVDLEDALSEKAIQERIETFESLKGTDVKAIAETLATVKGIRVIVGRKNLDECIISLDFGVSPAGLLPVAKEFFSEVLTRNQVSIPDASKWTPSIDGNTLAFRGRISSETIDDMVGIFTLQRQAPEIPKASSQSSTVRSSDSLKLEASKAYFDKTTNMIKRVREYTALNTGDRAGWNGKMARRIDEIPTLDVDPELVDFAAKVAEGLRGNMVAIIQTNISYGAAAVVNSSYSGYYNNGNQPYLYSGTMARAQGNSSYRQLSANIEQMEANMRRKMTEKYQFQF